MEEKPSIPNWEMRKHLSNWAKEHGLPFRANQMCNFCENTLHVQIRLLYDILQNDQVKREALNEVFPVPAEGGSTYMILEGTEYRCPCCHNWHPKSKG